MSRASRRPKLTFRERYAEMTGEVVALELMALHESPAWMRWTVSLALAITMSNALRTLGRRAA